MIDLQKIEVDEKTLSPKADEKTNDKKEEEDKSSKTVPYERFQKEVRNKQKAYEEIEGLKAKFGELEKKITSKGGIDEKDLTELDRKFGSYKHWDDLVPELSKAQLKFLLNDPAARKELRQALQTEEKQDEEKAMEQVEGEIETLKDDGIIQTKEDENKLIDYALKEAEESGQYISLKVAHRMMVKEGKWKKGIEDRSEANKKVRSAREGGEKMDEEKEAYRKFRRESLDDVISKEAEKWEKSQGK